MNRMKLNRWMSRFSVLGVVSMIGLTLTAVPSQADSIAVSLGQAAGYTVFALAMTVDSTGGGSVITGDVAIGNNGGFLFGGGSTINGNLTLGTGATFSPSGGSTVTGTTTTGVNLTQADTDAHNASTGFAALAASTTISGNLTSSQTFGSNGNNPTVVHVTGNIALGGSSQITLDGGANDYFIFNVDGSAAFGGTSGISLINGVTANHVIFNILLNSPNTVGLSMASGTHEFGTFLAVNTSTKIDGGSLLAPALTGAIIGDGTAGNTGILIQSTAYVTGDTFQTPVPEPVTMFLGGTGLLLLGYVGRRRLFGR